MNNRRNLVATAALVLLTALAPAVFAQSHYDSNGIVPLYRPVRFYLVDFSAPASPDPANSPVPAAVVAKSGALPAADGMRLKINTNLGNIHVFTDANGEVSYRVTLEADPRDPGTQEALSDLTVSARKIAGGISLEGQVPWRSFHGPFRVNFEIHIPRRYNVDATTQAGNIEIQDIDGQIALVTAGGDITVGRVGGPEASRSRNSHSGNSAGHIAARLETQGGQITVGEVLGDLRATTAGGHISTGNIAGNAILHTDGGHIHTGRIAGIATLDTGGGNIQVGGTGSSVTASTAGGQIDFGTAAGNIRAHTGGGAVRIDRFSGPATMEASGGNLFLRQVDGPLRVSEATGNITAWFTTEADAKAGASGKQRGVSEMPSELTSVQGDIIVYLPRGLAATIDAVVEQGGAHRIIADPSLPLKLSYQDSASGARTIHGEGSINGGGEVLHLKAASGNIVLNIGEPDSRSSAALRAPHGAQPPPLPPGWNPNENGDQSDFDAEGFMGEIRRRILESWHGNVPVDPSEIQNLLESSVPPIYPEVARQAGVEGDVVLRAYISSEGSVTELKVLAGPPILARAAIEAVRQWRYQPVKVNGRAVNVVTTLVIAFRTQ